MPTDVSELIARMVGGLLVPAILVYLGIRLRKGQKKRLGLALLVLGLILGVSAIGLNVTRIITNTTPVPIHDEKEPIVARQVIPNDEMKQEIDNKFSDSLGEFLVSEISKLAGRPATDFHSVNGVIEINGIKIAKNDIYVDGKLTVSSFGGIVGAEFVRVTCQVQDSTSATSLAGKCRKAVDEAFGLDESAP